MLSGTAFFPIEAVGEKYVGMCNASAAVALDKNTGSIKNHASSGLWQNHQS
jgi:hypothetical protein